MHDRITVTDIEIELVQCLGPRGDKVFLDMHDDVGTRKPRSQRISIAAKLLAYCRKKQLHSSDLTHSVLRALCRSRSLSANRIIVRAARYHARTQIMSRPWSASRHLWRARPAPAAIVDPRTGPAGRASRSASELGVGSQQAFVLTNLPPNCTERSRRLRCCDRGESSSA